MNLINHHHDADRREVDELGYRHYEASVSELGKEKKQQDPG